MFAEAAVKLESAQLLLERGGQQRRPARPADRRRDGHGQVRRQPGRFRAADVAVQAMGATGFCEDSLVEYCFRRTRGWMIAGGSIEILKNRIAEHVFGRRFPSAGDLR